MYSEAGGSALAVQAVPALTEAVELGLGVATAGYTTGVPMAISWEALDVLPDGWTATLVDRTSGAEYDLTVAGRAPFTASASGRVAPSDAPAALALRPVPLEIGDAEARRSSGFTVRFAPASTAGEGDQPQPFAVGQPYPNPARGQATVPYHVASASTVRVVVFDALGRRVVESVSPVAAGAQSARLDVSALAAGTYVVQVSVESDVSTEVASRRLLIVR